MYHYTATPCSASFVSVSLIHLYQTTVACNSQQDIEPSITQSPQRMPLTIKINPNLYDRQPTKSEALRIIAQIDLLKGYIRSLV